MRAHFLYLIVIFSLAVPLKSMANSPTPISVGGTLQTATANALDSACSGSNSGTLTLSGQFGTIVRWETSTSGGNPWSSIAHTGTSYTYSNLTQTTYFRVIVKNGGDPEAASTSVQIRVDQATVVGTVTGDNFVCTNSNSGVINVTAGTGGIVSWQTSFNNGTAWNENATNVNAQSYTNLTATTWYRAVAQNGACAKDTSNIAKVIVNTQTAGGTVLAKNGLATITACIGNQQDTLTLSGKSGNVIGWETANSNSGPWSYIFNSGTKEVYQNLNSTTYYRAIVHNPGCDTVFSAIGKIEIDSASTAGNISGTEDLCAGTNSGSLTLSGNTGSVQNWLTSTDGTNYSLLPNPTSSYSISNQVQTTYYKAFVKNGVCPNDTSNAHLVEVNAATVGGSVNGTSNVCFGINGGNLNLTGNTGEVLRWQSSPTGNNPWTDIVKLDSTLNYSNIENTTSFRAVVQNSGCLVAFSNAAKLTIDATTQSGTLTGTGAICASGNSGGVYSVNKTGSTVDWLTSTNNGATWSLVSTTNDTISFNNLATETWYRSIVKSGVCIADTTTIGKLTISPATVGGKVNDSAVVCASSNGATLKLSGHTGDIIRWESASNSGGPWGSVTNTTDSLVYSNLLNSAYFRAIVQSPDCNSLPSEAAYIDVIPVLRGGNLSGSTSVCDNSNSGVISLNNQSGNISKWQVSTDTMQTWTDISNTTTKNNYSNLTISSHYRVEITGPSCGSLFSDTAVVWVNSTPISNYAVTRVCQSSISAFTNQTINGNANTYFWDLGDGNSALTENPNHIYANPGSYSVQLTVTSANNCISSITKTAIVDTLPVVNYTHTTECVGNATMFTNSSTPAAGNSNWSFGNGQTSTNYSPSNGYAANGNYKVKLTFTAPNNCVDSAVKSVTVNATPNSSWSVPKTAENKSVTFANNSNIATGNLSYLWKFGDGNTSNAQNPTHTFADTGNYSTELIAFTQFCSDTLTKTVVVNPVPTADFNVNSACVTDTVQFTNNSFVKKGGMTYSWNFGDGNTSNDTNPRYRYTTPGAYNVTVVSTSDSGYSDTKILPIVINEAPTANFNFVAVCAGDSTPFTDNSFIKGGSLTHLWDFGVTGGASISANPKFAYSSAGNYTAKLTVTSINGCIDSVSRTVLVNALPNVKFGNDTVCDGASTTFIDSTTIANASASSFSWDFGNNVGSNVKNPLYQYAGYGTYSVKLKVTSNLGCVDSLTKNVVVNPNPTPVYTSTNACINDSSVFTNSSTYPLAGGNLTYSWDFGNGTGTSTLQNPKYAYSTDGSYNVKLVVTETNTNCKDSVTTVVLAHPRSNPGFSSSSVCLGQNLTFQNNSTVKLGNLTSNWNFGDLGTSTATNPTHSYANSGKYTTRLITTTINNCSDTISRDVWVHPQPNTDFTLTNSCFEDSAYIFDNSQFSNGANIPDTVVNFAWDFGDGNTDTVKNPVHYYTGPGNYKITLTQTTDSGCTDLETKNITIYANPVSDFVFTNVCLNDTTPFTNRSFSVQGTLTYKWDFGGGVTDTIENVNLVFTTQGKHEVQLVATSQFGCTDTNKKEVISYELPAIAFDFNNTCDGFKMPFSDSSKIARGTINSYNWDFGDGTGSGVKSPSHLYLNSGKYDVTLKAFSDKGCLASAAKTVEVYEVPVANFTVNNACLNTEIDPENNSTITAGSLTYEWTLEQLSSVVPQPVFMPEESRSYELKMVTASENQCKDSLVRGFEVYPLPEITTGADTTVSLGFDVMLAASGGVSYDWIPQTGLDNSKAENPKYTALEDAIFTVTGTDDNGCVNTAIQTITVTNDYSVIPTNVITPDGNGQNDFWIIENIENYKNCEVRIFDRWGGEVLNVTEYNNDWDGRNENGDILPDGSYFYTISFPNSDRTYKGALTILRNNK